MDYTTLTDKELDAAAWALLEQSKGIQAELDLILWERVRRGEAELQRIDPKFMKWLRKKRGY